MEEKFITFMDNQWLQIEDNIITMGVNEDGLLEVDPIVAVDLPKEDEPVTENEICGELDSRDGPLNIYSPIDGTVIELNSAVIDTPELIREDPFGEGWLLRVEVENTEDIDRLLKADNEDLDDDEEDDFQDEEED